MREKLNLPRKWDGQVWRYRNLGGEHTMHQHAELECNLIARGTGVYLLANRKYQVSRGDLLWLFPAQEHVLIGPSPDFEMWIGVFKPRLVARVAREPDFRILRQANPPGQYCRRLTHRAFARLEALFGDVATAQGQPDLYNAALGYALLAAWQSFTHAGAVPTDDLHPAVEKVAHLISDETAVSPSLVALARHAGLSPARLSRLFKQQTGVPLVRFRNRLRLGRFLRLYGAGQRRTMLDAALAAGFGSYPQFHRVFRQVMGCSPASYRARPGPTRDKFLDPAAEPAGISR